MNVCATHVCVTQKRDKKRDSMRLCLCCMCIVVFVCMSEGSLLINVTSFCKWSVVNISSDISTAPLSASLILLPCSNRILPLSQFRLSSILLLLNWEVCAWDREAEKGQSDRVCVCAWVWITVASFYITSHVTPPFSFANAVFLQCTYTGVLFSLCIDWVLWRVSCPFMNLCVFNSISARKQIYPAHQTNKLPIQHRSF